MTQNIKTETLNLLNTTTVWMPSAYEITLQPPHCRRGSWGGGVGQTVGLTNPLPRSGRCQAGFSNTGGPPLPRKMGTFKKRVVVTTKHPKVINFSTFIFST